MFTTVLFANDVMIKFMKGMFVKSRNMMKKINKAKRWKYLSNKIEYNVNLYPQNDNDMEDSECFLEKVISKMGIFFTVPEEIIFAQGERANSMLFIQKGDCTISIKDKDDREIERFKLLVEGDHLGEIALIYKCYRTATCIGRYYNTMARLSAARYNELKCDFPELNMNMKQHLFSYNDVNKEFIYSILARIEYLRKMNNS